MAAFGGADFVAAVCDNVVCPTRRGNASFQLMSRVNAMGRLMRRTPAVGTNRHCAFKDFRYMWDDKSGKVGAGAWVIAGGDTVIIRGCTAGAGQKNPSNPNCRIGWDAPTGTGDNLWCYGVGSYTCYNPPIPAGTAAQHTRILGQNYASCNVGGATNPKTVRLEPDTTLRRIQPEVRIESDGYPVCRCSVLEITSHITEMHKGWGSRLSARVR